MASCLSAYAIRQTPRNWLGKIAQGVSAALMVGVPGASVMPVPEQHAVQWVANVANAEEAASGR